MKLAVFFIVWIVGAFANAFLMSLVTTSIPINIIEGFIFGAIYTSILIAIYYKLGCTL